MKVTAIRAKHPTKAPHHTQKRNKVWKKKLARKQAGETKNEGVLKPGYLQQVVKDRIAALDGITLADIKPTYEFPLKPTKENGYDFSKRKLPQDLQHRMLSYIDQFDTPIRPKQVVKHFSEHPTNPVTKDMAYGMMKKLANYHNLYKIKKIDEEGQEHWFVTTSTQSRVRHNKTLQSLINKKQPLPLEEVVWEEFDESQSFVNLREMKTSTAHV